MTTATEEVYQRDMSINLIVTFRPGSKVHGKRLAAIKEQVEEALREAVGVQLPNATADVYSSYTWSYRFKDEATEFVIGEEDDEEALAAAAIAEAVAD